MSERIGIVTGGGDCPGLNAVIRAVTKAAAKRGWETIGFLGSWTACTGGVLVRGLTPQRSTDSIGFGVVYGKFSPDLQAAQQLAQAVNPTVRVREYEMVLEWDYRMRIRNGAMSFQPDLQYIVNPGGAHQYANALQVGAQAGMNF
jgi:carbohydrate-selective porin OprB